MPKKPKTLSEQDELSIVDSYVSKGVSVRALSQQWHKRDSFIAAILQGHGIKLRTRQESYQQRHKSCGENCLLNSRCPTCWKKRAKDSALKYYFGLSLTQYDAMHAAQGGACAICFRKETGKRLAVNHDHAIGTVRGLLCQNCNTGIGLLNDEPRRLRNAADYIESRMGDT